MIGDVRDAEIHNNKVMYIMDLHVLETCRMDSVVVVDVVVAVNTALVGYFSTWRQAGSSCRFCQVYMRHADDILTTRVCFMLD